MLVYQNFWHPDKKINNAANVSLGCSDYPDGSENIYSDVDKKEFIELKKENDFHVRAFKDKPLDTVICKKCNGSTFSIGVDGNQSYFTVIKCNNCHWELLIHAD